MNKEQIIQRLATDPHYRWTFVDAVIKYQQQERREPAIVAALLVLVGVIMGVLGTLAVQSITDYLSTH